MSRPNDPVSLTIFIATKDNLWIVGPEDKQIVTANEMEIVRKDMSNL